MKHTIAILLLFAFAASAPLWASGGGSSSKPLAGSYPVILSHGGFGWGDSEPIGATFIFKYFGGMDDYLRSQGAQVYAPTKTAVQSTEYRAAELKNKVRSWMAAGGYSKVHIIGHCQGGLDGRYAVSNLGLASQVKTLTTVNSPHRGTPLADIQAAITPDWLKPYVALVTESLAKLIFGGAQNGLASMNAFLAPNIASFNSRTPNVSSVKYFSYGSRMTLPDPVQHLSLFALFPIAAAGGLARGDGAANDGMVPLSSMQWGTWKGQPAFPWYASGIDHLQVVNMLNSGETWFDVEGFFLNMALNAKAAQ